MCTTVVRCKVSLPWGIAQFCFLKIVSIARVLISKTPPESWPLSESCTWTRTCLSQTGAGHGGSAVQLFQGALLGAPKHPLFSASRGNEGV